MASSLKLNVYSGRFLLIVKASVSLFFSLLNFHPFFLSYSNIEEMISDILATIKVHIFPQTLEVLIICATMIKKFSCL